MPITGSNPTPITSSNPTPEETMREKVPDEGDNLPEGSGDVIDETIHDSPCQHFDLEKDGALISFDSGRHDGSDLRVGRHFKSKEELHIKLSLVAINGKFEIKVKKSTKTLKEVICVNESCLWRVRAVNRSGSNFFVIRQYNGIHTCSLVNRSINHRQASSCVIGARLQGHFKENKEPPNPKSLMGFMREELKVHVSYWKAWRGGKFAQDLVRGTPEHGFAMLPSYCYILKKENPGTVTHIEVDAENKFLYFFMALGVAISGFRYMRKVIGIDASFVKTKYKGMLIVASAQDSEYHSYLIAWALVDIEKNASWTWFLEKLKELIPNSSELCFISDRNQSIQNSVSRATRGKPERPWCRSCLVGVAGQKNVWTT
ncbi:hypothetical protein L484_026864 [Morus notabilis]|uniref:MULE transposase domain-containing protein n=1 Tax=Morus notabilis TaxID=981085 RepID=W9RUL6_9ROSA|nr:uncharacterized protein LOC21409504 [Morus notabilis]EXB73701.1 hypothetical protein L484_026864 [Morus notabilis]